MAERKSVPPHKETFVLTSLGRRCCFCFGINHDYREKRGQIAHLDHDPSNNELDNLAFLCLDHHDAYDGKTRQSKNYKIDEAKHYRAELYTEVSRRRAESSTGASKPIEQPQHDLKGEILDLLESINPKVIEQLRGRAKEIPVMISTPKLAALQQLQTSQGFGRLLRFQPTGSVNIGFRNQVGNSINDVDEGFLMGFILFPQDELIS